MNTTKYFPYHYLAKEKSHKVKILKKPKRANIYNKLLWLICFIILSIFYVEAQNGPFLRFSLGPGFMKEYSTINKAGFTIATKNHAIGWGFKDKYAVSISEFGAFIRKNIGEEYQYINFDAYGLGFAYRTKSNINFHVSGAYGTVHFSDSWKKQGDFMEDGYAIALGVDKKWVLSKRFDIGAGPHTFLLKTTKYTFTNFSINFWLDFYLFPQQ